ncbi:MAG: 3-isopropylmalate dehydratase large subunit [Coriobacteriia bacterium]|nr:3-isopropylmalate dehydratase large subunit [Coriobacteriia bacterium]MCL2871351.1 3-isopropylmalate dehydratase large subunit [Coriobacteriia bacterium]
MAARPMTMTQKILASAAGLDEVKAGELVQVKLDLVLGNDITAPVAIQEFYGADFDAVFDSEKIALVMDHFTPSKDIKAAENCKVCREFARKHKIKHFYDVGAMGIEHALLPELGIVAAGECIIGADSHTCTYGALGAFSTGVGSTDMAAGMATGEAWFKVPGAIRVNLTGKLRPMVSGKDIVLRLIGIIGVDGALYQSLEYTGEGVASLTMDDRFCIANMAIEAGAKNGIFPVDEVTRDYMQDRVNRNYQIFEADADAPYARTVEIDLSALEPTVAFPHLPENTRAIGDARDSSGGSLAIDQVVIGSCTNGWLSDMQAAAEILEGKKIHPDIRCIVIPGTQQIYLDALEKGYIKTFVEAGCVVSTPTCGPCLGGHMGVLAAGERCVATTNRNFVGRMGHVDSEVYLASAQVAAASAIKGAISDPRALSEIQQGEAEAQKKEEGV